MVRPLPFTRVKFSKLVNYMNGVWNGRGDDFYSRWLFFWLLSFPVTFFRVNQVTCLYFLWLFLWWLIFPVTFFQWPFPVPLFQVTFFLGKKSHVTSFRWPCFRGSKLALPLKLLVNRDYFWYYDQNRKTRCKIFNKWITSFESIKTYPEETFLTMSQKECFRLTWKYWDNFKLGFRMFQT